MGDPRFVFDLRAGREPRARTIRRVRAYLDLLDRLASRGAQESQLAFLYKTHPPMWERRDALEEAIGTRFDTLGGSAPALKTAAP